MTTLSQLKEKYVHVPDEIKVMKRWVCFKLETDKDGKTQKYPYNAITGKKAKVNDDLTWSRFEMALKGCVKYNFDGIGFVLGDGIFGIDLDNHQDKEGNFQLSEEDFDRLTNEFIKILDSYSEKSQSGLGVHIICKGKLPKGGRRRGSIEMYDSGRFFAFTGNIIHNTAINDREEEIVPLWEKYINVNRPSKPSENGERRVYDFSLRLTDDEIIQKACSSTKGQTFAKYYYDGDLTMNGGDHSQADMSFCNQLAFWCNGDKDQMDRIFRSSALMRDKWDEKRGIDTYGNITLDNACAMVTNGYNPPKNKIELDSFVTDSFVDSNGEVHEQNDYKGYNSNSVIPEMNIDEKGEPIFRIKKIYNKYPYNDTGNAERFYDYFGELFKYNKTDKLFMYWTGKTWIRDIGDSMIRKYANRFIGILKDEISYLNEEMEEAIQEGRKDEAVKISEIIKAASKNADRVANKTGKDNMIYEFRSLYDVPVESSVFDKEDFLLNTDSGIVDLKTGEICPFDKSKMISYNTNIKVSYDEPEVWLKFLHDIFFNGNEEETQKTIDSLQTCLGYSLTGSCREQCIFIMYGGGSNGKSTFSEQITHVLGTYSDSISSSVLMQQRNNNSSAIYSLAKLKGKRFVETGETDDNGKLAESFVKSISGGDTISAQYKYGNEFSFRPNFKMWLSTNNKPIIKGTDNGIWRRIFMFPFVNSFDGKNKDKDMPIKLKNESEKILGWCIKGFIKYTQLGGNLIIPDSLVKVKQDYREQMDVVAQFIKKECILNPSCEVECKTLYSQYKEWGANNSEYIMKESKFAEELKLKGIIFKESSLGERSYVGLKLKSTKGYY